MNQTFKNFWAHRRQNGFVFVEIALIAVLSFYFIDYFMVTYYDRYLCRPATQFETEHLLVGQVGILNDAGHWNEVRDRNLVIPVDLDTTKMNPALADEYLKDMANLFALRDKVRALPEVEHAALTYSYINGQWSWITAYSPEADTTRLCGAFPEKYLLHQQYFETQGIRAIEGSPSAAELSESCPEDGAVITRSLAIALFGTEQAVGKRFVGWVQKVGENESHPRDHYIVAGVMEDFRIAFDDRYAYSIMTPVTSAMRSGLLIRLKPEVDTEAFVSRLTLPGDLQAGRYALVRLHTMKNVEKQSGTAMEYNILGTFIALLLLNVMLGTLGTFWLQIRKRTEDIGIMRSFGAKRRDIFWMLWREAALLTLIAAVVGQIIWLQFAMNIGLAKGHTLSGTGQESDWLSIFWLHYLVVCAIQYIILLIIVTLGMVVPTFRAMYKRPVEALHHE